MKNQGKKGKREPFIKTVLVAFLCAALMMTSIPVPVYAADAEENDITYAEAPDISAEAYEAEANEAAPEPEMNEEEPVSDPEVSAEEPAGETLVGDGEIPLEKQNGYYLIQSAEDWEALANYVDNGGHTEYNDDYKFRLMNDISTSVMITGTINGKFDGFGRKITVDIQDDGEECAALFRSTGQFEIGNLRIDGIIRTSKPYAGSLVGRGGNTLLIYECVSSVTIESTYSGKASHGGFVGTDQRFTEKLELKGCIFNGQFTGENTSGCGGFVGYHLGINYVGAFYIKDCLFMPSNVTINTDGCYNFSQDIGTAFDITSSYYLCDFGQVNRGALRPCAVTTGSDVLRSFPDKWIWYRYSTSNITALRHGLLLGDILYAPMGETTEMVLEYTGDGSDMGFIPSAGELSGNGNEYILYVPSEDEVVIEAVANQDITVQCDGGATVSIAAKSAPKNRVTFSVNMKKGYVLESVLANGGDIDLTKNEDGTYTFLMPSEDVVVAVATSELPSYTITVECGDKVTVTAPEAEYVGEEVSFSLELNPYYAIQLGDITVNGGDVPVSLNNNGTYTFTMPGEPVIISVPYEVTQELHRVIIGEAPEFGTLQADAEYVAVGTRVKVDVIIEYRDYTTIDYVRCDGVDLEAEDGSYYFDMPDNDVTLTAHSSTGGTLGDNLTWSLTGGLLTVTGSGEMAEGRPWHDHYYRDVKYVEIEDGVTSIARSAFGGCYLTGVTIPDSVTSIGSYAFSNCSYLTDVTLPKNLVRLGDRAFMYSGLKSISIPGGVEKIEMYTFAWCSGLTSVSVSEGVKEIEMGTFKECTHLESVVLPKTLTTLGDEVFYGSENLKHVDLSGASCAVGNRAFYLCESLETLTGAQGITELHMYVFSYSGLKSISLSDSLTLMEERAFYDAKNLESVTLGDAFEYIPERAFYECESLKNITLPKNLKWIGAYAFDECYSLEAIEFPDRITSLDRRAFALCKNLKEITIPANLTNLTASAFSGCYAVTDVYFYGKDFSGYAFDTTYDFNAPANTVLHILCSIDLESLTAEKDGGIYAWYAANPDNVINDIYEEGYSKITIVPTDGGRIRANAYMKPGEETQFTVITDDHFVFSSVKATLESGTELELTDLGDGNYSFIMPEEEVFLEASFERLYSITIDEGITGGTVTASAGEALEGTPITLAIEPEDRYILTELTLNGTPVEPENGVYSFAMPAEDVAVTAAFMKLYSITIDEAITDGTVAASAGEALAGTKITLTVEPEEDCGLIEVTLNGTALEPENGGYGFAMPEEDVLISASFVRYEKCGPKLYWRFSEGLLTIFGNGEMDDYSMVSGAPWQSLEVREAVIESGATSISDEAFYRCSDMKVLSLPDTLETIGSKAFMECSSLTEVRLPNVKTIGERSFSGCEGLRTLVIGEGMVEIGDRAFERCDSLTEVTLPVSLTSIGEDAFVGCTSITDVWIKGMSYSEYSFDGRGVVDDFNTPSGTVLHIPAEKNPEELEQYTDGAVYEWYAQNPASVVNNFEVATEPVFRTHSLALGGRIGVNFFMELPDLEGTSYDDSWMEFTVSGKGGTTTTVPYDETFTNDSGQYYGFTCLVNALQMADRITAVFHYKADGEERTVESVYSVEQYVRDYAELAEQKPAQYGALLPFVKSLADYGHYTQIYLAAQKGFTLGDESADHAAMNTFYKEGGYSADEAAEALSSLDGMGAVITKNGDIAKITGSLALDSETAINLYVTCSDGYSGGVKAAAEGANVTAKKQKDGRYKVVIPNIGANMLGRMYDVTLTTSAGSDPAGVSISAMSYVKAYLGKENLTQDEENAMMALYEYYREAEKIALR